jgi:hypothetical protein
MRVLVSVLAVVTLLVSVVVAEATIVEGVDIPGAFPLKTPPVVDVERTLTYVFIDFDDMTAPCIFAQTGPLGNEYLALGVSFSGPAPGDGAAVLNECGGFGVSGHSSPNFLATNCNSSMQNGGTPWGPETLTFTDTVSSCSALVGGASAAGQTLSMDAYTAGGALVDSDTVVLQAYMQLISVAGTGIKTVVVGNIQPCVWVLDDLGFDTEISPVEASTWGAIKAMYQ